MTRTHTTVMALIAGAVAVLGASSYAMADGGSREVEARTLSGYFEVPAISSSARGSFEARINGDELRYRLSYSGLEGSVTQAHIHFAQLSVNGGISVWLCGTAAAPGPAGTPTCPSSGTVTRTIDEDDIVGPSGQGIAAGEFDELVAALRASRAYANVHSTLFGTGEIRGQIGRDGDD